MFVQPEQANIVPGSDGYFEKTCGRGQIRSILAPSAFKRESIR
jgi:hypothetical protein